MTRAMILTVMTAIGLGALATPARAQLFGGPKYRVRIERDGDVIVKGRGYVPVVVDPYVTTVATFPIPTATTYVSTTPVLATTRVFAPTAVVVSRPLPTVSYLPTTVYAPARFVSPGYLATTRVIADPYVTTSFSPLFPTAAVAYPWP